MTVQIFTDASIKEGAGSWACVILRADSEDHVESSGKLRGSYRSSTATEGAAMANALWFAKSRGLVKPGERVTIISDNRDIVGRIKASLNGTPWRKDAKDPAIMEAAGYVQQVARKLGIDLAVEWIKGHQRMDSANPYAIYNIRCDHLAAEARTGVATYGFDVLREKVAKAQDRRANSEAA